MKKNNFFFIALLICNSLIVNAQNQNTTENNTLKSLKIWRTSNNSEGVIGFPVTSFSIPANTTKYINMMVNYAAQPDIAIAIDAVNENSDGNLANIIRPLNSYTNFGEWETLVFPVSGGENGIQVNTLLIYPDLGIENKPVGQILNNSGVFGYIDEIVLKSQNTLSVEKIDRENNGILVYPNPTKSIFKISTEKEIKTLSIFTNLGKNVTKNIFKNNNKEYDISNLSTGLYFIKIIDNLGNITTKKLVKK